MDAVDRILKFFHQGWTLSLFLLIGIAFVIGISIGRVIEQSTGQSPIQVTPELVILAPGQRAIITVDPNKELGVFSSVEHPVNTKLVTRIPGMDVNKNTLEVNPNFPIDFLINGSRVQIIDGPRRQGINQQGDESYLFWKVTNAQVIGWVAENWLQLDHDYLDQGQPDQRFELPPLHEEIILQPSMYAFVFVNEGKVAALYRGVDEIISPNLLLIDDWDKEECTYRYKRRSPIGCIAHNDVVYVIEGPLTHTVGPGSHAITTEFYKVRTETITGWIVGDVLRPLGSPQEE